MSPAYGVADRSSDHRVAGDGASAPEHVVGLALYPHVGLWGRVAEDGARSVFEAFVEE